MRIILMILIVLTGCGIPTKQLKPLPKKVSEQIDCTSGVKQKRFIGRILECNGVGGYCIFQKYPSFYWKIPWKKLEKSKCGQGRIRDLLYQSNLSHIDKILIPLYQMIPEHVKTVMINECSGTLLDIFRSSRGRMKHAQFLAVHGGKTARDLGVTLKGEDPNIIPVWICDKEVHLCFRIDKGAGCLDFD